MNNHIEFLNCVFEENRGGFSGVVHIVSHAGNVVFRNCLFFKNRAYVMYGTPTGAGSVISLGGSINIIVENFFCLFIENYAYLLGIPKVNITIN